MRFISQKAVPAVIIFIHCQISLWLISLWYDCLAVFFLFFYVSGKKLSVLAYFFGHKHLLEFYGSECELPIITVISMCTNNKDVSVLFACMNPCKKIFTINIQIIR